MLLNRMKQTVLGVCAVQQGLRLYPAEHPQIKRQVEKAVAGMNALTADHGKLRIRLLDDSLRLNDLPCIDQLSALQDLIQQFKRQQLQSIDFYPGVDNRQLLFFCQQLPSLYGGKFSERLEQAEINAIRANLADEEPFDPQATYWNAIETVEEFCRDVRLGQIPSSQKVVSSVKSLLNSILTAPNTLYAMTLLKGYDNYTFNHSVNVSVLSITVGTACGVSPEELYTLGLGGMLHDLGKMTIDHKIISKAGNLSREEMERMQLHPVNGAKIVARMEQMSDQVVDIVNNHHLHFDRNGYPTDSRGRNVTPLADMVCIADIFDAMTTVRCYQRPCTPKQALARMTEFSGSRLHPGYLQRFIDYVGPYPVGTLVRLQDRCIGLACDVNRQAAGMLTVKILFDESGAKLAEPQLRQSVAIGQIVAEVDPLLKGVRLEDYLPA